MNNVLRITLISSVSVLGAASATLVGYIWGKTNGVKQTLAGQYTLENGKPRRQPARDNEARA